ncbi:MAG: response regulator transcription factor [Thermoleophilia bacterium]
MARAPLRVLVASHSPAWSAGIAAFLSTPALAPEVAFTVDAALAVLDGGPVGLAVVDRVVADAAGAELAAEMRRRHPDVPILFAVRDDSPPSRLEALAAGAAGTLLPTWTREAVLDAAEEAIRRGPGPELDLRTVSPLADLTRRTGPREVLLTDQERAVLRLMRQHLTYKEIAQRLGVSWHTVRTHAQAILRKFGVHSRRDLDAWDARMGTSAPPPVRR